MKHEIKGHQIEVESYACPSMLWFGVGLRVLFDGKEIARSANRCEGLRTRVPFEIPLGTAKIAGHVVSEGIVSVRRTRYSLFIGDQQSGTGCVRAKNWYITYGLILVTCVLAGIWMKWRH